MGHLSDRYGRRPLLLTCCIAFVVLPWPLFTYLASGNVPYVVLVADPDRDRDPDLALLRRRAGRDRRDLPDAHAARPG